MKKLFTSLFLFWTIISLIINEFFFLYNLINSFKEISFKKPNSDTRMSYNKLGRRNAMAISVVSIAVMLEMESGKCKKVRISLGAVAPKPVRAYGVEEMLEGKEVTEILIESCCEHIQREINPINDIRASAEYRRAMASVLLRRLIQEVTQ